MPPILLAVSVLLFSLAPASAWWGTGHMVVTALAWRQMTPPEQEQVHVLLKAHPKYEAWSAAYPEDVPGLSRGLFVAMAASLWADDIRDKNNPATHPAWHYVDYPLLPPSFPDEPAPHPEDDILFGIRASEQTARDGNATPAARAEAVAWLIHLVGDLHQPLHCAALINNDFPAPDGDRGGNSAYIRPDEGGQAINLHMLWDSQLGGARKADGASSRETLQKVILLETQHPRSSLPELGQHPLPYDWSKEGRGVAVEHVYLNGTLRYGLSRLNAPVLPQGYTKRAKAISERRVVLAGMRLAATLKAAVAPVTPSPPATGDPGDKEEP